MTLSYNRSFHFFFFLTATLLFSLWLWAGAARGESDAVFTPVEPTAADGGRSGRTALTVRFNPTPLDQVQRRNTQTEWALPLPDQQAAAVTYLRTDSLANGRTVWVGRLSDDPLSEVSLALRNQDGQRQMVGIVRTFHSTYRIRPAETAGNSDLYTIERITTPFPAELEPIIPALDPSTAPVTLPRGTMDDSSVIDVLVLYTSAAREAESNLDQLIDLAMSTTNTGYEASQVTFRAEMVHAAEINYNEAGKSFSTVLEEIRVNSTARSLRNEYGADTVLLLVENRSYCGLAYLMNDPSSLFSEYAYGVISTTCMISNLSFPHELGHLLGAQHDRGNSGGLTGAYAYSYGYQDPQGEFRTVMAYLSGCNGSNPCPRVNQWSNPAVNYEGQGATGISPNSANGAANYLTLNNTVSIVANFRQRVVQPTPTPSLTPSATPSSTPTPVPTFTPTPTLTPTPLPLISAVLQPGDESQLEGDNITLTIPENGISEPLTVIIESVAANNLPQQRRQNDYEPTYFQYNLSGSNTNNPTSPVELLAPFQIEIRYSENGVSDLQEETLTLFYWDQTAETWLEASNVALDTNGNRVSGFGDQFTYWALMGRPYPNLFLPFIHLE